MPARKLIGLTIFTLAALALLIGLGVWQLQRLEWKRGLVAEIETRTKAPPVGLADALALVKKGDDVDYMRIKLRGSFEHDKERYLYAINADGEPGWHVIVPFDTDTGDLVLVDRGFVPEQRRDPASRPEGQLQGVVDITGLARPPESQGLFVPNNEPENNRWFFRDLNGMMFSMYPTATMDPVPFFVEAEQGDVPGGWPRGGQTRLDLPDNHLQYAITWFLLALCLLVIYGLYVGAALRGPKP
jgi:surfeit locus 1 family protein